MTVKDEAYFEALMMKAVDGFLDRAEAEELDRWLAANPDRAAELEEMTSIKEVTDQMRQRLMADARIEPFREDGGARAMSWLLFTLIFAGLALLCGFGVVQMLSNAEVPGAVRWGAGLATAGTLGLFARVLWTRIRSMGSDPYEEIDR